MANVAIQTYVDPITVRRIEAGVYVVTSTVNGTEFRVHIERLGTVGEWYVLPQFQSENVRPRSLAGSLRDAKTVACEVIANGMRDLSRTYEMGSLGSRSAIDKACKVERRGQKFYKGA